MNTLTRATMIASDRVGRFLVRTRAFPSLYTHYCVCCERPVPWFMPFGIPPRRGALCPRCSSLERHRLLWMYLRKHTNIRTDRLDVLHVAPEPAIQAKLQAQPNLNYLSADLDSPYAMMKMDLTAIPFPARSFDVVLCSHVLEHVPDDRRAMREIARVLRPTGWAILQVPSDERRAATYEDPSITDPAGRLRAFGQEDHVRIYGRDYADRLREAGFTVQIVPFARQVGPAARRRYGLPADEHIYFCTLRTE